MPGGPINPEAPYYVDVDTTFENIHVGGGANSKEESGIGVEATLSADSTVRLRFSLPPAIPAGTAKIRLIALANATTGAAKVEISWASVSAESSPSGATLTAEGIQTVTWASGDADVYKELKTTLTSFAGTANDELVVDLGFKTAAYTLAAVSTWKARLIWE